MSVSKHPVWRAIAWIFGFEVLVFGLLIMFCLIGDQRFGIQIGTAIAYTILIPLYVFAGGRLGRSFAVRDPRSTVMFPKLILIHIVFTCLLLVVQTIAFGIKSRLPSAFMEETGPKHDSWYSLSLIVLTVLIGMAEIVWLRSILEKSRNETSGKLYD